MRASKSLQPPPLKHLLLQKITGRETISLRITKMRRVKAETTKAVDVVVVPITKLLETLISSGVVEELAVMIIEVVEEKTTITLSSNDRISRKRIDVVAVMVLLVMVALVVEEGAVAATRMTISVNG